MAIKVYEPKISVTLQKVIRRAEVSENLPVSDRYQVRSIDLTQYFGDMGGVRTTKGVREPAGGFSLTLADRMEGLHQESLYGLIEPMDLIEIRMAHDPSEYRTAKLPIVMRGFVSEVSRDETMGSDGKPSRRVTVTGQDYGKILQILQIIYTNNSTHGDNIIHGLKFLQKYKVDAMTNPPANDFLALVIDKIINPYLREMIYWEDDSRGRVYSHVSMRVSDITDNVSHKLVNEWPGGQGIYYLLTHVLDVKTGFNELFVIDEEVGPVIIFRPTPWKTADHHYVQEHAGEVVIDPVYIEDVDVVSLNATRSDAAVANLFWVRAPHFAMAYDVRMRLYSQMDVLAKYPNCDPKVYGIRQMETETMLGNPLGAGDSENRLHAGEKDFRSFQDERIHVLEAAARDTVVFERGSMRLRGNEKIKTGCFLYVRRGSEAYYSEHYITQVDHEFVPYQGFFTTVTFERGTGFIRRSQKQESPYLTEISARGI